MSGYTDDTLASYGLSQPDTEYIQKPYSPATLVETRSSWPKVYVIIFDRGECSASGGRVERVTWSHFAAQGRGLSDHLNIERAHLVRDRMECHPAMALADGYLAATGPSKVGTLFRNDHMHFGAVSMAVAIDNVPDQVFDRTFK